MDKGLRVQAIGRCLGALIGVLIKNTQPITHLWAICDAVFRLAIFGIVATKTF